MHFNVSWESSDDIVRQLIDLGDGMGMFGTTKNKPYSIGIEGISRKDSLTSPV